MALQLQMNWQPDLIHQNRKTGPPVGLRNLGNTCYLNSVLQCLTYTPPLANFCLKFQHSSICDSFDPGNRKRDCPFCILEKRIARSLSLDIHLDSPSKILRCLRLFAESFRTGYQEDAHEFLRYVIDACHTTCLRLKKLQQKRRKSVSNADSGSFNTVVRDIFGGALQSQVKCISCGGESNKVDEIMDISLDVVHSSSLKEAMENFFCPEVLDGNNKYKCPNCKELVEAKKQMFILQAPNILVIQLKRFEGVFGAKVDKPISFEEELMLSSFMSKTSKIGRVIDKGDQDSFTAYKLFGTIIHSGYSPESGHYYAYVKDVMGRWYCCNDSYISPSTLQDVLSEKVYILFFSRASDAPKPEVPNRHDDPHIAKSAVCDDTVRVKIDCPSVPSSSHIMESVALKCNGKIDVRRKYEESNGDLTDEAENSAPSSIPESLTEDNVKSGYKRKLQDDNTNSVLCKDVRVRPKLEELTSELRKEAYTVLSSSDWSRDVYDCMRSRKLTLRQEPDGIRPTDDELRKKLVADARSTFISQIPMQLKGSLVDQLRTFFKENS